MTKVWILTREENQYDQYGEYFENVWLHKPTEEELLEIGVTHLGRKFYSAHSYDNTWYNLVELDVD